MTTPQRPTHWIFRNILLKFSPEGFRSVNIVDMLNKVGYSKTEARRLISDGSVKIWDTRLGGNKIVWYKICVNDSELVEPGDVLIIGGARYITLKAIPINIFLRVYYAVRPCFERLYERFVPC